MAKKESNEYIKLMENYKIARKSGRKADAESLFLKMRKLAREKKVDSTAIEIGAYL